MISWIRNKLAEPVLPILVQLFKVSLAVESTLGSVLKIITENGVTVGSPIYNKVERVLIAIMTFKEAISKIIQFLGGSLPVTSSSSVDLDEELKKLKSLL